MIESFKIENYRRFKNFKLSKLGRVNLLVGENNSGKTSILEALYVFTSYPNLNSLLEILDNREEYLLEEVSVDFEHSINTNLKSYRKKFITYYLFNNLDLDVLGQFSFIGFRNDKKCQLDVSSVHKMQHNLDKIAQNNQLTDKERMDKKMTQITLFYEVAERILYFCFKQDEKDIIDLELNINRDDFLSISDNINFSIFNQKKEMNTQLINPWNRNVENLKKFFNNISLTPKEDIVIKILQIIEPRIKAIATREIERGSFKVLLEGDEQPIHLGTMGDGIWRLLTIALAMVNTQNGVLLIDEIDTGLHFTTLLKMWELILETSKKLNVQVFATTHNSDCWMALGELIAKKNEEENHNYIAENEITLHRIEADKNESILFDAEGILIAKDNDIEVR